MSQWFIDFFNKSDLIGRTSKPTMNAVDELSGCVGGAITWGLFIFTFLYFLGSYYDKK